MRERKIALRAHMMHLFHGALHWMRNIVLKAVPITTGVTTQKTDSPPWTPYCFKLQWQLSPGALTYTPQRIWKDNFLPQTALIHWLQGGTFWVSYETHPSFFFFYLPFFFFLLADPAICAFAACFVLISLLLVSDSATSSQCRSTAMHFHGNNSGEVLVPQVLHAAHSLMVLADCTCRCAFLRDAHAWNRSPSVNPSWQSEAGTRKAPHPRLHRHAAPALAEREELGSQLSDTPGMKYAHSKPTTRGVSVSRLTMPGGSDGWEQDTSSVTPCTLIPHVVLKTRDGKPLSCQPTSWWSSISIFPLIQGIYNKQWEEFLSKNWRGNRWTTS